MTGEAAAAARLRRVLTQPITHISYAVDDVAQAVRHWVRLLGAGPFFVIDPVRFDSVETGDGQPARWDHTAAFGQWGSVCIELQQLHSATPPGMEALLTPGPTPIANHVSLLSDSPEADSAALVAAGAPAFVHATTGGVEVWLHDTRALIGQALEIHRASPDARDFFARIASAADGWDGSEPLRPLAW